ncbi:hypothetical protein [Buchnera aphidicola]
MIIVDELDIENGIKYFFGTELKTDRINGIYILIFVDNTMISLGLIVLFL